MQAYLRIKHFGDMDKMEGSVNGYWRLESDDSFDRLMSLCYSNYPRFSLRTRDVIHEVALEDENMLSIIHYGDLDFPTTLLLDEAPTPSGYFGKIYDQMAYFNSATGTLDVHRISREWDVEIFEKRSVDGDKLALEILCRDLSSGSETLKTFQFERFHPFEEELSELRLSRMSLHERRDGLSVQFYDECFRDLPLRFQYVIELAFYGEDGWSTDHHNKVYDIFGSEKQINKPIARWLCHGDTSEEDPRDHPVTSLVPANRMHLKVSEGFACFKDFVYMSNEHFDDSGWQYAVKLYDQGSKWRASPLDNTNIMSASLAAPAATVSVPVSHANGEVEKDTNTNGTLPTEANTGNNADDASGKGASVKTNQSEPKTASASGQSPRDQDGLKSHLLVGQVRRRLWIRPLLPQKEIRRAQSLYTTYLAQRPRATVKEGWMHKLGEVVASWKRRKFVLKNDKIMYYNNLNSKKGEFSLIGAKVRAATREECGTFAHGIALTLPSPEDNKDGVCGSVKATISRHPADQAGGAAVTRYLRCDSEMSRDEWLSVLSHQIMMHNPISTGQVARSIFPFSDPQISMEGRLYIGMAPAVEDKKVRINGDLTEELVLSALANRPLDAIPWYSRRVELRSYFLECILESDSHAPRRTSVGMMDLSTAVYKDHSDDDRAFSVTGSLVARSKTHALVIESVDPLKQTSYTAISNKIEKKGLLYERELLFLSGSLEEKLAWREAIKQILKQHSGRFDACMFREIETDAEALERIQNYRVAQTGGIARLKSSYNLYSARSDMSSSKNDFDDDDDVDDSGGVDSSSVSAPESRMHENGLDGDVGTTGSSTLAGSPNLKASSPTSLSPGQSGQSWSTVGGLLKEADAMYTDSLSKEARRRLQSELNNDRDNESDGDDQNSIDESIREPAPAKNNDYNIAEDLVTTFSRFALRTDKVFQGTYVQKKMTDDMFYRKRFVWINPETLHFQW